jgi:hypothetical protein
VKPFVALSIALALVACKKSEKPKDEAKKDPDKTPTSASYDKLTRVDFNRLAVRENLPLYWIADTDKDKSVDPDEVATLLFYPTAPAWTDAKGFTKDFDTAYAQLLTAATAKIDDARLELVAKELDQGRATLVRSDFTTLSAADKEFVGHMMKVASLIDALYDLTTGAAALAPKVPADGLSQSLFRRNRGPECQAPLTEKDPACSAIPGSPKPLVDVYPAAIQKEGFCQALEKRPDAEELLRPFNVVRGTGEDLKAVAYTEAYATQMQAIATELDAAADSIKDAAEAPLITYLHAAAASFHSNDWQPADEAWSKMNAENSKWYVRVAPDETYWEPCAHKAGFHLTFARINQGSLEWQKKLVPVQQDMEGAVAAKAGAPYQARTVSFHLPDFIDIVVNAGDDRDAMGATIGQSLPNWGPVANEGRGRTVAMSNLYTDPDSMAARRDQAESLLDAAAMGAYVDSQGVGLLSTILHEATHNLGPHAEYKVDGKTDDQAFGGPLASTLEELKAQTGALFLIEFLRGKGVIDDQLAAQTYVDSIVWAFGHISRGMYTADHEPKPYSQLAAIQIGFLIDQGALTWDDATAAANGSDHGAFTIHSDKMVAAIDEMMKVVAGIKARGDKAGAEELIKKYVDGDTVPQKVISERMQRYPKANFVYTVAL